MNEPRPASPGSARGGPLGGVRLVLFARSPRPGRVKTRLVPPLTPAEALALHLAFVEDQLRFLLGFRKDGAGVALSVDGPFRAAGELARLLPAVALEEQGPGDLGERMLRSVQRSAGRGARATVLVAADAPTLPADRLRASLAALDRGAHAALSPAEDGGYVLLAMREPHGALFRDIPWGEARVLEATRVRAREAALRLAETPPWYDVDDGPSLWRLLGDPELRRRAPATARALGKLDPARIRVV